MVTVWAEGSSAATRPHRQGRIPPTGSALVALPGLHGMPWIYRHRYMPSQALSASIGGFYSCRVFIFPCLCSPFSCLQYVDKRNGKLTTFNHKMPRPAYSMQLLCLCYCLSQFECTPHTDIIRQIEQTVFRYSIYMKIHMLLSPAASGRKRN